MKRPRSSYRLQVNKDFPLARVRELIDYFADLGVSHLYFSPILQARPGSTHGYDVINPNAVNPEVGTPDELEALSQELRGRGIGIVLDIVPNHMAASEANPWWRDLLMHGEASPYSTFFDVDWTAEPPGPGRILLPVLGKEVEQCIRDRELVCKLVDGEAVISYAGRDFPIAPETQELFVSAVQGTADAVRALLDAQHYCLQYWRPGAERINYRRFFDISDLAGLRTEDHEVFTAVHERLMQWVSGQTIEGLRIDHIDGLRDPVRYLERLDQATRVATEEQPYVVVEKILIGDEPLPQHWKTAGTTGYDFIGTINGLFIDPNGFRAIREAYGRWTRITDFRELLREKKKLVMRNLFPAELNSLGRAADRILKGYSRQDVQTALVELTAALPIYRTYVAETIEPADRELIRAAALDAEAKGAPAPALRALVDALLDPRLPDNRELMLRWQQVTGPVMAKGLEDTSFYNYYPLLSICEVGSNPADPLITSAAFHDRMRWRQQDWPGTMNGSSTHDTKRAEDVRARINVLSELFEEWITFVERSLQQTQPPDVNDAVMLYQTLIGAWPLEQAAHQDFGERITRTLEKSMREAKRKSSWRNPDEQYERAMKDYAARLLTDDAFVTRFREIERKTAWYGALNSLSQLVLKLMAPGVPDIYQGNELWSLDLVDPDNRRPVDYDRRAKAAAETSVAELRTSWRDGRIKSHVTRRGLALRNALPDLFARGDYRPVEIRGNHAERLIAFERKHGESRVVAVASRYLTVVTAPEQWPTAESWGDTTLDLAEASWTNIITGERGVSRRAADLLGTLPFAILQF